MWETTKANPVLALTVHATLTLNASNCLLFGTISELQREERVSGELQLTPDSQVASVRFVFAV